jgi:hypothetical protein
LSKNENKDFILISFFKNINLSELTIYYTIDSNTNIIVSTINTDGINESIFNNSINSNQNNKTINTSKNNISKIKKQITENKLLYIKNISIKGIQIQYDDILFESYLQIINSQTNIKLKKNDYIVFNYHPNTL